jgi:hypothetical protein
MPGADFRSTEIAERLQAVERLTMWRAAADSAFLKAKKA